MNTVVTISSILLLVMMATAVITGPFAISKLRGSFSAGGYISVLVQATLTVIVVGRALGWW